MTDQEFEQQMAEMDKWIEKNCKWWDSPEVIREEAALEASIKETTEAERQLEAWIKEHSNN
jgi:hypothetical protein